MVLDGCLRKKLDHINMRRRSLVDFHHSGPIIGPSKKKEGRMLKTVTKEGDGIIKNIDITRYFLVPHHEDAFLTVQSENGVWGISDDHAGEFTFFANREEAERMAEQKILQYRREWMEIREKSLPDDTDDPGWNAHEEDSMWMEKAAKAVDTRAKSLSVKP
jgi:hypothetical protein